MLSRLGCSWQILANNSTPDVSVSSLFRFSNLPPFRVTVAKDRLPVPLPAAKIEAVMRQLFADGKRQKAGKLAKQKTGREKGKSEGEERKRPSKSAASSTGQSKKKRRRSRAGKSSAS